MAFEIRDCVELSAPGMPAPQHGDRARTPRGDELLDDRHAQLRRNRIGVDVKDSTKVVGPRAWSLAAKPRKSAVAGAPWDLDYQIERASERACAPRTRANVDDSERRGRGSVAARLDVA